MHKTVQATMYFPQASRDWWPETVKVEIWDFPLWTRRSIRSGGPTGPYLIKQLSVLDKTERQGRDKGKHKMRERILMAKLLPPAWVGKQTEEWLPSTTPQPLLLYPLDGSLWRDLTNLLRKGLASPITCTGCAGRSHHFWEEDMTFQSLKMWF